MSVKSIKSVVAIAVIVLSVCFFGGCAANEDAVSAGATNFLPRLGM